MVIAVRTLGHHNTLFSSSSVLVIGTPAVWTYFLLYTGEIQMYDFQGDVLLEDEFLRDGLQNETRLFTLSEKLEILSAIVKAGARRVQVGSFVNPKLVPQMAGTDEIFASLPADDGVTYSALVLSKSGLDRALDAGAKHLSISLSASDTHSLKNTNRTLDRARVEITPVIEKALAEGILVRAGIQSAFGCGYEGHIDPARIRNIACGFSDLGVQEINIADTAGLAHPAQVFSLCTKLREEISPNVLLSLHLHDTRGLGLANMVAGLQAGVRIFDAALGGLGGCPFIPKATGNIATEDAAFLCQQLGLSTGIDWQALRSPVKRIESLLGRVLPAKITHLDVPPLMGSAQI
jgi:hydroxymethylglutaryl-CoA lyase